MDISSLPCLPLIIIQDHDWEFYVAEMHTATQIVIYRDEKMGSTSSLLGVYELLAATRRLARWVDEVYRRWLEKEILEIKWEKSKKA